MDTPHALGEEIARMAAHLDAATHRLLTCVRRFDESGEWGRQGALSCAHWLSWRIGLDVMTAREKVRVARALGGLPSIDEALRRGKLSYAKVRALTRVATAENEGRLLDLAVASTGAQLERICRSFRRVVADQLSGDPTLDERRYVSERVLPSGMVRVEAVLHPDEAALVMKAIETARAGVRAAGEREAPANVDVPAETSARSTVSKPDALVQVAESFLAHGQATGTGGDRCQIFVHLQQDPLAPDGTLTLAATLDDGTCVPAETFRRLACDAALVSVTHDAAGNPLDIGRRTRTIPPALRRALWSRDRGCRFPSCANTHYVHAHHIDHWAHGGETSLDNLVLLCGSHHRLLHEGGIGVTRTAGGRLEFRDSQRRVVNSLPEAVDVPGEALGAIEMWVAAADFRIDAETNLPEWDGTRVDYDAAISAAGAWS
jgi:hypothetical protein